MNITLDPYGSELQENQNSSTGLILGTYQPDKDKPEQGFITTLDGRSFKVKLMNQVKVEYEQGLDLSQPMLFTVYPKPSFGDSFVLSVVRVSQINNELNQGKANLYDARWIRLIFSRLNRNWHRLLAFLSSFNKDA